MHHFYQSGRSDFYTTVSLLPIWSPGITFTLTSHFYFYQSGHTSLLVGLSHAQAKLKVHLDKAVFGKYPILGASMYQTSYADFG